MADKSNDVLEEQIKTLFKLQEDNKETFLNAFSEIKEILKEMRNDTVSKDQLKTALELHDSKSQTRHQKLEDDIIILKRIIYGVIVAVFGAFGKSFLALFTFIIK